MGSKPGHLEHPHYIAVSNTNRVIVSDSNNHRIQIFDANGKVNTTFGSEGTDAGQFKFPRWFIHSYCITSNKNTMIWQSIYCIICISYVGACQWTRKATFTSQIPAIIASKFSTLTAHSSDASEDGDRWIFFRLFASAFFPCNIHSKEFKYTVRILLNAKNHWKILQGEGEFKGLEGIAVNSKGSILVADRENHRVQIF